MIPCLTITLKMVQDTNKPILNILNHVSYHNPKFQISLQLTKKNHIFLISEHL